jgi:hypothetical protein
LILTFIFPPTQNAIVFVQHPTPVPTQTLALSPVLSTRLASDATMHPVATKVEAEHCPVHRRYLLFLLHLLLSVQIRSSSLASLATCPSGQAADNMHHSIRIITTIQRSVLLLRTRNDLPPFS